VKQVNHVRVIRSIIICISVFALFHTFSDAQHKGTILPNNVGNHSVPVPLDIGVADPPGGRNVLDVSYLPVVTICQKPALTTCINTTDPGRAMISGNSADVGRFKGPILRGLAARAPYFHNGSARSLMDVVDFYDSRFNIGFTRQEKLDLVAFLNSL
jgi:cytochrome c peroxidase